MKSFIKYCLVAGLVLAFGVSRIEAGNSFKDYIKGKRSWDYFYRFTSLDLKYRNVNEDDGGWYYDHIYNPTRVDHADVAALLTHFILVKKMSNNPLVTVKGFSLSLRELLEAVIVGAEGTIDNWYKTGNWTPSVFFYGVTRTLLTNKATRPLIEGVARKLGMPDHYVQNPLMLTIAMMVSHTLTRDILNTVILKSIFRNERAYKSSSLYLTHQ